MKKNKFLAFTAAFCLAVQMMPAANLYAEETGSTDFIYGDVNEDQKIDISDLSLVSLHLIKDITLTGNKLSAADTDGDGTVTLADLAHLRRFISKYAVKLGPQTDVKLLLRPASSYTEISELAEKTTVYDFDEKDYMINAVPDTMATIAPTAAPGSAPTVSSPSDSEGIRHSETYNQEENVLEADIVKTDGNAIFSLSGVYDGSSCFNLNAVYASDGKFISNQQAVDTVRECSTGELKDVYAQDMYLYNDMIIVLGTAEIAYSKDSDGYPLSGWYYGYRNSKPYTFVSVFTKGDKDNAPELIDTYFQEGKYNDVRITSDGFMYLVSDGIYRILSDDENEDIRVDDTSFIPAAGSSGSISPIACNCIYIPEKIDDTCSKSYTVIGSINLNSADGIKNPETKVISGYSGNIYCSGKNLYLTHSRYEYAYYFGLYSSSDIKKGEQVFTEITRVSLSKGKITPEATGVVPGFIINQFSMSEYRDYFRIVTTSEYSDSDKPYFTREKSNNVFVLDQNLEKAGEITHFAKDESVKAVNFAGDIGYVVTYVQTDPLFAIDFSEPSNPAILDEFKIDGYSTYMQKWDDSHLLGFGVSTYINEYGGEVTDGYKLVMFNNSDPENLSAEGIFKVIKNDTQLIDLIAGTELSEDGPVKPHINFNSNAVSERKALLIAPEKNLIGFPVTLYASDSYKKYNGSGYFFFSYEDGEFTLINYLGDIKDTGYNYADYYRGIFERAVYIGDYVYIISDSRIFSADIETCTKTDEISLGE